MKWSKSYLFTLRDAPSDAEIPSHKLMSRAGLIRKVAPGIYTYGTLALRAIRKFEQIVREELERRGCQEVLMPMVQPAELWQETGRWTEMGENLLKFENRNGHSFCLGATHEEVITDYVRRDVKSYRDLPANLYQIQTKYRDEIRPRFGLMRGREFVMKDAYSFDVDQKAALASYESMYEAYRAIFSRLGLEFRVVEADAGSIGGSRTHEFQLLAEAGEDHLMVCDACDFAANIEVAPVVAKATPRTENPKALEAFPTPGLKTIDDLARALNVPSSDLVKTLFVDTSNAAPGAARKGAMPACVLVRGSDELNPIKLKNLLGLANPPAMLTDDEVRNVSGASPGSCGPVGLKIPIFMDQAIGDGLITGANRDDEHLRNVSPQRDFNPTKIADLTMAKAGDACPKCSGGHYRSHRGIEVGHVFYLGTKYSELMQANYLTAEGTPKPIEMGCYGIGITRTIQAAIEQSHDKDGIVWPPAIAPFAVHVVLLDPDDEEVAQSAEVIYRQLKSYGLEPFLDDRPERPGVKFKDADLLGLPLRLNIGKRGLQSGEVELIVRRTKEMTKVKAEDVVEKAAELFGEMMRATRT